MRFTSKLTGRASVWSKVATFPRKGRKPSRAANISVHPITSTVLGEVNATDLGGAAARRGLANGTAIALHGTQDRCTLRGRVGLTGCLGVSIQSRLFQTTGKDIWRGQAAGHWMSQGYLRVDKVFVVLFANEGVVRFQHATFSIGTVVLHKQKEQIRVSKGIPPYKYNSFDLGFVQRHLRCNIADTRSKQLRQTKWGVYETTKDHFMAYDELHEAARHNGLTVAVHVVKVAKLTTVVGLHPIWDRKT